MEIEIGTVGGYEEVGRDLHVSRNGNVVRPVE